jgi:peptide/nickel transport system ATP-binding protein
MIEAIRAHRAVSTAAARDRAIDLLELVGIPDPHRRVNAYPHELSRGALTRVVIAMALANAPKLLIADEPTATLDITVQAQILALLEELQERLGVAILFVTRDLGVAAQVADEVVVMYAGRIVEQAPAEEIFATPQHPYTWGLLRSMPGVARPREGAPPIPGVAPSPINLPAGCVFHPRCPYARDFHGRVIPQLALVDPEGGHRVACLLEAPVRSRIWDGLLAGQTPEALAALVDLEPAPEAGP